MISSFYKKFSLDNLKKAKPKGQVATLLILMIVVMLIMILTTVNLGQLSLSSTNLANVADSSALYLASQLASRANQISQSLFLSCGNGMECCTRGWGWFSWIFVIVAVVIVTVVTYGQGTPYVVGWATAAGAAAGAAASAIAGTSIIQGTLQGAMIGAAIGGGVSQGATAGASMGESSAISAANASMVGSTAATDYAWVEAYMTAYNTALAPYVTAGAIAGGGLAAGSSIYNATVADQNQAAAFSAASRMLNGLPDYDRFREGVFLQAFSQTVDDPNKDLDTDDLNANGVVDEKIPHFLTWWNDRTDDIKAGVMPILISITDTFFNTTLKDFTDDIQNEINQGTLSGSGSIAKVASALQPEFWDSQYDNGSFISIVDGFQKFVTATGEIRGVDIDQLASHWRDYIVNFYNEHAGEIVESLAMSSEGAPAGPPDEGGPVRITDYYTILGDAIDSMELWKPQITEKRNALKPCYGIKVYDIDAETGQPLESFTCQNPCDYCNECIVNPPPCKFNDSPSGTVDDTYNDQITPVLSDIDRLIEKIAGFRVAIKQYVQDMEDAYANFVEHGGTNPAVYAWSDSRGSHSVKVEVGDYKVPHTINTSSGGAWSKKICIRLVDYSDDGTHCKVTISRTDPQDKDVQSGRVNLGKWNPFFNGIITKKAKAAYNLDKVELAR